jgi:acyl-CoA reductase-like NAD-dependent aldehyde dehydrogenase
MSQDTTSSWTGLGDLATLLVDGKVAPAASGATFTTLNPATEDVLGVAADGGAADLDAAIAAARHAFDTDVGGWTTDPAFRARCLRELRDALVPRLMRFGPARRQFLRVAGGLDHPVRTRG